MKVNELQFHDSMWVNFKCMLCEKKEEEKKEKLILEKDIQDDYIYFKCKQN